MVLLDVPERRQEQVSFFVVAAAVTVFRARASCTVGKYSTTELHSQSRAIRF